MLAGLDVGGTHTDAVLIQSGRCVARAKAPTRAGDPLPGMLEALAALFATGRDPAAVRRLTVSTTLGLNALLTGTTDPVGMLAVPGPGLDPALFWPEDPLFYLLEGAMDHRGRVTVAVDPDEAERALRLLRERGARAVGIVVKFSPKNPEPERELARAAARVFGPETPVVLGAAVSGSLNFPRRLHTVWCNAALAAIAARFTAALETSARDMGLTCPIRVLKADAGSFTAWASTLDPAAAMGSGPAASLLGVWALSGVRPANAADQLMIDMGGTSTDLALLAGGQPLLAPQGLNAAGRPTLIRTLWTASLALGGDSSLRAKGGTLLIGPDRSGPALSLHAEPGTTEAALKEGRPPTLTDAMNAAGVSRLGDTAVSIAAMERLAGEQGCPAHVRGDGRALAHLFVDQALDALGRAADALLAEVNARPVYTIRELLVDKPLRPDRAVFIGGPAEALAEKASSVLRMSVVVPPQSAYANAMGAALARPTRSAELYADTLLGRMTIPDFGVDRPVDRRYDLEDAKVDMLSAFAGHDGDAPAQPGALRKPGSPGAPGGPDARDPADEAAGVQIVFAERFAVLDPGAGRGRILRVRAQRAAGLVGEVGTQGGETGIGAAGGGDD